jgi:hypothetical protein
MTGFYHRTSEIDSDETRKPNKNAPASTPRSWPDASKIGGNNSENALLTLT